MERTAAANRETNTSNRLPPGLSINREPVSTSNPLGSTPNKVTINLAGQL